MWRMIVSDARSSVAATNGNFNFRTAAVYQAEKVLTNRKVRKGFVYGKHIARRPVCRTILRLEIVMRDKEIICVQTLGTRVTEGITMTPLEERHNTLGEYHTVHSCSTTM